MHLAENDGMNACALPWLAAGQRPGSGRGAMPPAQVARFNLRVHSLGSFDVD